jgi:hypothetical protein
MSRHESRLSFDIEANGRQREEKEEQVKCVQEEGQEREKYRLGISYPVHNSNPIGPELAFAGG